LVGFATLAATLSPAASAATFVAYGPVTYVRSTGVPVPVTTSFTVLDANTTYTLRIDNSGVSSAVVTLNGAEVAGPNDFNANVTIITKPVTLLLNNQLTVELRGATGRSFILQIIGVDNVPPTITGAVTPPPNSAGWHKSNPTVTFTCADTTSGIASCTAPVTVTTETASQVVVGIAVDNAGNTATTSVTVKLDKTPPNLVITSPTDGSQVFATPIAVSGTVADSLSGLATLTCNGAPATVNGTAFSCSVPLVPGPNSIIALATDVAGNTSTRSVTVNLGGAPPTITDFNPKSGSIGTLVNITGSNFAQGSIAPQVNLNKQGGGTILAPLSNFTATSIAFVIPAGAATGPLIVSAGGQSATSTSSLTLVASSNFALAAAPNTVDVIQGQSGAFAVTLSSSNGFAQLAGLNVTGLPSGVTASFKPQQITAGQTSVLTIRTPSGQPTGAATLSISAKATVDGIELTQSASATLNIKPITTSFLGRTVVADTLETPLAGVTIKFTGKNSSGNPTACSAQTVSDAAGNFAFTDLPVGCTGEQLIRYDGLTATSPPGDYAGVDLVYNIVANQVTASPVLVHLPRIDDKETVMVQQNASADQTFVFRTVPGLSVTVYAGTRLSLVDGTQPNPFPFTAVQVPIDRLPDAKPPNPQMVMVFIVAFQPANATASQPVAVYFPNTINTPPGTNMVLMTLDPTKGSMVPYGTGTVANDGSQVIPDLDPAHPGRRYGLVHFDWHGQMPPPPPIRRSPDGPCGPKEGKPVDLSSGVEVITETDIAINGGRGRIEVERTYRTLSTLPGPFGIGSSHNYGFRLNTTAPQNSATLNLIMPDSNQNAFIRQPDGTLINTDIPSLRGVVMTTASDGTATLRWKDGTLFRFVASDFLLGSVLQSISDPNGNTVTLIRNSSRPAQITNVVDPVGRRLVLSYDSSDRVTSIVDPIGRTVGYTYNSRGTLETVTDPEGGVTRYDYDSQNRLTRVTDARGVVVAQNTYDENGRVVEQVQADGGRIRYAYTLNNPIAQTGCGGPGVVCVLVGSRVIETAVTDAMANRTIYRFNPEGFPISVTDSLGQTRILDREPGTNMLLAVTGAGSCKVCGVSGVGDLTFTYDNNGNRLTETDELGNTTTYTYEQFFNKLSVITNPLGHTTRYEYDSKANLTSVTDPGGNRTTFTYDSFGLLVQVNDPTNQTTVFGYDLAGNLVSIRDALGHNKYFRNDGISRVVESLDSLGKRSRTEYDRLNRVIVATNPNANTTFFSYDSIGGLLTVTDARSSRTTHSYDAMGRLASRIDSLGKTETYRYDFNGNLIEFTDRRGKTSSFRYDPMNRLMTENDQDGTTISRSYDSSGRLLQAEDSTGGVFSFKYDRTGRLIQSASPMGVIDYTRDRIGRVTSRRVSGQPQVDYTYDALGNLTRAAMSQGVVSMIYEAHNLLQTIVRSNGVRSTYGYDALGRLLSLTHTNGAIVLNAQTFSYDALGNRTGHASDISQTLKTQPAVAQYDDANRLIRFGGNSYTYDANGNRLSKTSADGTTTYTWDDRNRLQSILTPSGETTSFLYDFAGHLIQQRTTGDGQDMVDRFVLDDLTNVALLESSNGDQLSVLSGRELDQYFAISSPTTQARFALMGALNTPVAITGSTGTIDGRLLYEPYGQTTSNGATFPFGYTGRTRAADLYYYRARFYDPEAGSFLSEDPIGFAGGDANLRRYTRDNPLNLTDPTGLLTIPFVGWVDFGESYGEAALNYYVSITLNPEATWYEKGGAYVGAFFSALWTCDTSDKTFTVLSLAYPIRNISWTLRDGSRAHTLIDFGDLFRLEYHKIGKGALNAPRWHIDALWGRVRHWPWGF